MQELAYSTYCSLKYLSEQGYLFQESQQSRVVPHFTIAWQTFRELTKEQALVV